MDAPEQEPGLADGYKVQRNVKDILAELEFMKKHIERMDYFVQNWAREDVKTAWHSITMGLWRIDGKANDARNRVYKDQGERRRGDTGPLRNMRRPEER
ncbi:MAG: hypothetical protein ACYS6W_12850 [Planctomycetota bacterium]|jgi:hypothetical protein